MKLFSHLLWFLVSYMSDPQSVPLFWDRLRAYDVYYGDAEPMLEYPWVKNLGIRTVEELR